MGRITASCAALVALTLALSACQCPKPAPQPVAKAKNVVVMRSDDSRAMHDGTVMVMHEDGAMASGPGERGEFMERHHGGRGGPCHRYVDCSACYFSEADSDVHRMRDDLPHGGSCRHCEEDDD